MTHIIVTISAIFMTALASAAAGHALVSVPVACMRDSAAHSSELVSQALLGTPLRVLACQEDSEWALVESPDSYRGYVNVSSLRFMSEEEFDGWKMSSRLMVMPMGNVLVVRDTLASSSRNLVSTLSGGCIVSGSASPSGAYVSVTLPGGERGFVPSSTVVPLSRESFGLLDCKAMTDSCHALLGAPYLWGGMSTAAMDCSGLVRIALMTQGYVMPRDASQQYQTSEKHYDGFEKGDLLFFSTTPDGGITHVALYDDDGCYIHCSGHVRVSHMDARDPDFSRRHFRGALKVSPAVAVSVADHPMYFLQQ